MKNYMILVMINDNIDLFYIKEFLLDEKELI